MKFIVTTIIMIMAIMAFSENVKLTGSRLSPKLLNYQGYLTDAQGNPISNSSLSLSFAIFDSPSGGNQKWTETQASVSVEKGIFNVLLGSVTPLPDSVFTNSASRYLQLTVAGQVLLPRTRIVSAPYAYTATYSDTAQYALNTINDNDWTRSGRKVTTYYTTDSVGIQTTTPRYALDVNGIICGGTADTANGVGSFVGGGYSNITGGDYATVAGGWNNSANLYATVSGGFQNTAGAAYSGAISGYNNIAGDAVDDTTATVCGGSWNTAGAKYSFVGSGQVNNAYGQSSVIVGGRLNHTNDPHTAIVSGESNLAYGYYSGIGFGYDNTVGNDPSDTACVIGGGYLNTSNGKYCFVGGGRNNNAMNNSAVVGGGYADTAVGSYSTVAGGFHNVANAYSSTVGGGYENTATNSYSTVCGGYQDTASGAYAIVGGGYLNTASGSYTTVGGGRNNSASGQYSTVGGGYDNSASGNYATVSGGLFDTVEAYYGGVLSGYRNRAGTDTFDTTATVAGGWRNHANGKYSFVGGGYKNTANSYYATVAGGDSNMANYDYATVGGGHGNISFGYNATVSGGVNNHALNSGATVAGGASDTSGAFYSFTVGENSTVPPGDDNSAAFNGQTTTSSGQTRVGILSKSSGTFTIDHPIDPENKILNHYFVESPEMVLIYRGSVVLNAGGRATVNLPDYFNALNEDPLIQLTGVGTSDVYIAEEVKENSFVVGGKPGAKVHWTVTGARKDPSAEITKVLMPVEQPKTGGLAGRSLDDEFLVATMARLERKGKASGFKFRHASEQKRYEEMKAQINK